MLGKNPWCRFRRGEEEIGVNESLWDWGLKFRTEIENGSRLETENSSLEIQRVKKRISLTEINYLWSFGGKKVGNESWSSSHIFMHLCLWITECKAVALEKTLEIVVDWIIGPSSWLPCDGASVCCVVFQCYPIVGGVYFPLVLNLVMWLAFDKGLLVDVLWAKASQLLVCFGLISVSWSFAG